MEKLKRGDKIAILSENESIIDNYLSCRDGIVEMYEYHDHSGYGQKTRLFLCQNTKHESVSIVRHYWHDTLKGWSEEDMSFDTDSFEIFKALIFGNKEVRGGKYFEIRNYENEGK